VIYEQGKIMEQWTLKFHDDKTKAYGMLKIRYCQGVNDLVEFDLELNAIPTELDNQGKDVTINWRMYDGFDAA